MKTFETVLNRLLESLAVLCFVAVFLIVVTLVVLRYVFNSSITGANELITVLFVYSTAIGAAVAVGRGEHIAISFYTGTLSGVRRRLVDAIGLLLVALLNAVMAWYSVEWIRTTGDFLMPSTELPRVVAQLSVPIGSGLAVVYCLLRLLDSATARGNAGSASGSDDGGGEE